jgi:NAD(P)-dependent dehydrogenase (short-subunit alcohol dehydrogenase family)
LTPRELTVLVPALNEEDNLRPTVERLMRALNVTIEEYEIIIVNDGSSDRTGAIADELAALNLGIRVVHNQRPSGLGHAYVQGIELASKAFFVYIPGDNTWPYRSFVELFGNLGKADVVTSYSTNPGVRPAGRRIVSRAYTVTLNALFGHRLHYFNGLTIYPTDFLRTRPVSTYGFGFQAEVLLKALDRGLSHIEVALPIDERTAGRSKAVNLRNIVSVAATIMRLLWDLRVPKSSRKRPEIAAHPAGDALARPSPTRKLRIAVTGASSGVGRELVRALAADGHQLFGCARREAQLREATYDGTIASYRVCDVTDEAAVRGLASAVDREWQGLDVLINCAGGFGAIGPIGLTESEEWLSTIRLNLYGSYLCVKHLLPLLSRSAEARILNFSGGGAFNPFPNYSAYACSKAAIVRLTECMAAELAPQGITVNAVAPGIVATPAHEATLRAGEKYAGTLHYRRTKAMLEEGGAPMANVVECVRALLSPELRGLTGKTISANFDPWRTATFREHVDDITRSDLYAFRRINIVNLPDGKMRTDLSEAWASYGTDR